MGPNQVFELAIVLLSVAVVWRLLGSHRPLLRRYCLIFIGVFLFEFSTQLLWQNKGLDWFTYLGPTLNWIITLGWTNIIFFSMLIIDRFNVSAGLPNFIWCLVLTVLVSLFAEQLVLSMGIRGYGPEITSFLIGNTVPLLTVPVEALYYMPVFIALILGFVGYWEMALVKPGRRR